MSSNETLSQDLLKDLLHYEPETGLFTWKVDRGSVKLKGKATGYLGNVGYMRITINRKCYLSHRLAFLYMTGSIPPQVDHINGIRSDNRWSNLRSCNNAQNNQNVRLSKNNTSGIKGVSWAKNVSKWIVQIGVGGKNIRLGIYEDIELAELVIKEAREHYHGRFANHG
jgi:hypothetical protein